MAEAMSWDRRDDESGGERPVHIWGQPETAPPAPSPWAPPQGGGDAAEPPSPRRRRRWLIPLVAGLVALAVAGGAVAAFQLREAPVATRTVPPVDFEQSTEAPATSSLAEMIESVLPAVVNVRVTSIAGGGGEVQASGSGVVIDPEGIILTNNHVVAGAVNVSVLFTDGREALDGTVVGTDPDRDLAVVKVEATDLTAVEIGRSGALRLGDQVVAIGFPLDLGGPTVTEGIVSGLNRTVQVQGSAGVERLVGLLQTDAAINPGNSGGPLVNASGQLVGINTAGVQAGAAENVGFAIAIDEALPAVEEVISQPPERRAWLGVSVVTVDSAAVAAQLGLPADVRGAAVVGIVSGSPADEAGLREGEVILAVGGREVADAEQLGDVLADLEPGDSVEVRLAGADGERTVSVELAQRPAGL